MSASSSIDARTQAVCDGMIHYGGQTDLRAVDRPGCFGLTVEVRRPLSLPRVWLVDMSSEWVRKDSLPITLAHQIAHKITQKNLTTIFSLNR